MTGSIVDKLKQTASSALRGIGLPGGGEVARPGLIFDLMSIEDANFQDTSLDQMLSYWRSKCGPDRIPMRADIEPHEIPSVLPDLYLMNVRDGGKDFQYRLIGTRIEEFLGVDLTGFWLDEVRPASILDRLLPLYRKAAVDRVPVYSEGRFLSSEAEYLKAKRLYAPLLTESDEVGQLMCVQTLDYQNPEDVGSYQLALSGISDGLLTYEQSQYVLG